MTPEAKPAQSGRLDAGPGPMPRRLISIVLPAHNQADHIAQVVEAYQSALDRLGEDYEILLVPNGCTDDTEEVCSTLAVQHDTIRQIDSPAAGWGRAVRVGLAAAHGDLLCYTNSARTQPETLALLLLYARVYPTVVVKANRRIRDSWRRRLGSVLYNLECRALFNLATWDINGTPKVFPRTFDRLLELESDGDMIDAEFVALCAADDYPVLEVPVLVTHRHGGRSTTSYASAARMYWGAFRLWVNMKR